jgi:hypothetical protein
MAIPAVFSYLLSVVLFCFSRSFNLRVGLSVSYMIVALASFIAFLPWGVLTHKYMLVMLLLVPTVIIVLGVSLTKGQIIDRLINSTVFFFSTVSITVVHFLGIAIIASGV